MSDELEAVLKIAIKKIIAEAIAETAAAGLKPALAGCAPAAAPVCPAPRVPVAVSGTGWERLKIAAKSLAIGAFALGSCGLASAFLFPADWAQAANDMAWMQNVHKEAQAQEQKQHALQLQVHLIRPSYDPNLTDINDPADPAVAGCMAQNTQNVPQKLTWADLASPSKLISMYKSDLFLHADADDLTAIIIFYELQRMARGESVNLKDLPADFKNSLPCKWLPAFNAVTAQYPAPTPLPPVPKDFIGPFVPYFE
jgi:hypothetical protein